jgi:flagellar biosynthesis protein
MNDTVPSINLFDTEKTADDIRRDITKAVALHYDKQKDTAPRVLASGKGVVAEQIISLAFANGVRVRSDANLVNVLSQIDVDSVIPLEAFTAVAEILNYVYQANATYGKPKPLEKK